MGYFGGPGSTDVEASKKKLVLIMDEVDGMSAGDRGGVGALAAVAKKSQIPMILICNDRKLQKMKPFDFVTYDLPFRRPTNDMIRSRISTIAFREGLKIPANVINALIEGSGADIRQVVNMISTAKLDSQTLSFEDGKDMSKSWEKHIVLKPWDMVAKILGGGLFNPASKSTLNDKQEIYFNDHEFASLMLQENYLGTNPARTNMFNDNPKQKNLAALDLVSKAADAISDGDLVDRMIHGSQQHWALMPTHAIFSFVRPASYVYGSLANHHTRFTAWLGKNSNQGKLMRMIKEIQGHMRLRVSADRFEVRQTYLPLLFELLVRRLQQDGKESVPEIIELMDAYFLTKDDWDAIMELGVGKDDMETVKIESQAKATFTRL
jgi:replication factor C subunit 1